MQKQNPKRGQFFEQAEPLSLAHDRAAGEQIFDALKRAILRMEIAPGALISETEVASLFHASRTPVRDALAQLRAAGLVVTSVGRGSFATKLTKASIQEARFIREALELGIVDALCERGLGFADKGEVLQALAAQQDCIDRDDKLGFQAYDDRFHLALAKATGFPRVAGILEREKMLLDRLRVLSLDQTNHMQELHAEHTAIFQAIEQGDRASARQLMTAHLQSVLATLTSLEARHQDYFA